MAIEIVDFPIKHDGSFNSYVKLPEGTVDVCDVNIIYPLVMTNSSPWKDPPCY